MNTGIGKVRTKLLDTDHKQWNCGMGVFDPNKVFYKEDPNGYVIIDGKKCKIDKIQYIYEKFGDKVYKAVRMPDDRLWLAENLSSVFDGINISEEVSTDPCMTFVDGVAYYNGYCIAVINEAIANKGWHVSTMDDWGGLVAAADISISDFGKYIKTTKYNGIDTFRFGAECLGSYQDGELLYFGQQGYFWTSNEYEESRNYAIRIQTSQDRLEVGILPKSNVFINIRLVSN